MAFTGLYSGRKIVMFSKERGFKITRTQTAKQAYSAIIKKYGEIVPNAKYQHKGKGNWVKYSLKNDKKRTGKTTTDIKKWRKQPHKLDYKGIDTKESKKKFAISQLKPSGTPKRRTEKTVKLQHKPSLKRMPKKEWWNKRTLNDSEIIPISKDWIFGFNGFSSRCTFAKRDGNAFGGYLLNQTVKFEPMKYAHRKEFRNIDIYKPGSFKDVIIHLDNLIKTRTKYAKIINDIKSYTGWKTLHTGRDDHPQFWALFSDGKRTYDFSENYITISPKREHRATKKEIKIKWNVQNLKSSLDKAKSIELPNRDIIYVAVGNSYNVKDELKSIGMKWNPSIKKWYSKTKPSQKIEGIKFEKMTV